MIEKESSQLNLPILKRDGRLLASRRDPVLEAQSWLNLELRNQFDYDGWIVLGFASGYALKSLSSQGFQNLVCIEASQELIDFVRSDDDFSEVRDYIVASTQVLESSISNLPKLVHILSTKYKVLRHPLTYTYESATYDRLQDFLNARTQMGMKVISELKGFGSMNLNCEMQIENPKILDLTDLSHYVTQCQSQCEVKATTNETPHYALKIASELVRRK